jgi:hypothetical protein
LVQQILLDDPEFLRRIVEHISNFSTKLQGVLGHAGP